MIFCCDSCKYLFAVPIRLSCCPDCGKKTVHLASADEVKEYAAYRDEFGPAERIVIPLEDILSASSAKSVIDSKRTSDSA